MTLYKRAEEFYIEIKEKIINKIIDSSEECPNYIKHTYEVLDSLDPSICMQHNMIAVGLVSGIYRELVSHSLAEIRRVGIIGQTRIQEASSFLDHYTKLTIESYLKEQENTGVSKDD